jgi:hypothetical protein
MGQGTSEAVAKVEETRARLDAEVAELQRRVPPMVDKAKRTAMTAVGAAAAGTVLLLGLRTVVRRRRRRRSRPSLADAVSAGTAAAAAVPARLIHEARDQLTSRLAA